MILATMHDNMLTPPQPAPLGVADQDLLKMATRLGRFGAWSADLGRSELCWSDEVYAIHEVEPGTVLSMRQGLDFYAPEYRSLLVSAFDACARDGTPFDLELELVTARGRRVWVRAIGEAVRQDGRVRGVQGAFQDISDRKEADARARALDRRLGDTLESITDGFYMVDRQWRFTFLNREAERLLKRERSGLLGKDVWEEFPEARGGILETEYRRAVDQGAPIKFEFWYEPLATWFEVRAFPSHQGLAVYFLDLTARKEAEQEIVRLNLDLEARVLQRTAELEEAHRELESFNYSISHDLRAPLRAIDGFAEALRAENGPQLSGEGARYVDGIRRGSARMARLVDDLLVFSGLGRHVLRHDAVDMGRLVASAVAGLREAYPATAIRVAPLPRVTGDAELMLRIWASLLANAFKFSAGREAPVVEVSHREAGEFHEFLVRDNGVGFDMRYAGKLFGVFQRLHREEEFPGTGVGLAIARRAVHRLGGTIRGEAADGAGATFAFTLRRAPS
jgi:PAS domain S-box-containing protein